MQQADTAFKNGEYSKAIELYRTYETTQISQQGYLHLLNLSSAYFSAGQYQQSIKKCQHYVQKCKQNKTQPKVEAYILFCKCLIKTKKLLSHEEHKLIEEGQKLYPYHKVLQQSIKTIKQLQISQNQDEYMDKIFQKLLSHPKIRNYMADQSFLTKVQKIIRNPSLANALAKTDKRLEQVTEVILMAQDDEQEQRNKHNQKNN